MRGGKREGAGRKEGTPNKSNQKIKDLIDSRIDFALVIDRLFELTQGIEVQQSGADGQDRIYSKPPDSQAAKILLEYGFGKPTQAIEVSTPRGIQITRNIVDRTSQP